MSDKREVTMCENCKYWCNIIFDPLIEHKIGECHCSQWKNDYFWYQTADNDFCSFARKVE